MIMSEERQENMDGNLEIQVNNKKITVKKKK